MSYTKRLLSVLLVLALCLGLLPAAVFAVDGIAIDATNFPDENFRNYICDQIDNGDKVLSADEVAGVISINVNGMGIQSLAGIEHFTALQMLHCTDNGIASLDVSNNTALTVLNCYYNRLQTLDVSANPQLFYLNCAENDLTSVNVAGCTGLLNLSCGGNRLTSLDVSTNTSLQVLSCINNLLVTLDTSCNPDLVNLQCSGNLLETLDLTANLNMDNLSAFNNVLTSVNMYSENSLSQVDLRFNRHRIQLQDGSFDLSALPGFDVARTQDWIGGSVSGSILTVEPNAPWVSYMYDLGNGWYTSFILTISDVPAYSDAVVDEATFPDPVFREYVRTQFDADRNGILSVMERDNAKVINVNGMGVQSLKGIEYFSALNQLLCADNGLTSLDLSQNAQIWLLACNYNNLQSLDLSGCPVLRDFNCAENALTQLDVSACAPLEYFYCGGNQLTELDVSANTRLSVLSCQNNRLIQLDVSKNERLTNLQCANNQLTSLDLSAQSNFLTFDVSGNGRHITLENGSFDLSTLPGFAVICAEDWQGGTVEDGILTVEPGVDTVTYLYNTGKDKRLQFSLYIDNPTADGVAINETNFPDSGFRGYVSANCDKNADDVLDEEEIAAVTTLMLSGPIVGSMEWQNIKGIEYFTALKDLTVAHFWNMTELDLSSNTALETLHISTMSASGLNISTCSALKNLSLRYTSVSNLDPAWVPNLEKLDICGSTGLNGIDLSAFANLKSVNLMETGVVIDPASYPNLEELMVNAGNVTALDFSALPNLKALCASGFASLDFSKAANLESLEMYGYGQTEVDLSGMPKLKTLSLENVTALDVSSNPALETVYLYSCSQLAELDLSHNPALQSLSIGGAGITKMDLSANPALKMLNLTQMPLAQLDITGCTALDSVNVEGSFAHLDVSSCTNLRQLGVMAPIYTLDVTGKTKLQTLLLNCTKVVAVDTDTCVNLSHLGGGNNGRTVLLNSDNTFDLSTLAGFDVTRASNWLGGTVEGKILTVTAGTEQVMYTYDCGNGRMMDFTLTVSQAGTSAAPSVSGSATIPQAEVVITPPAQGWVTGDNTFTVTSEKACLVAVTNDGGATYTLVEADPTSADGTSFTAQIGPESQVVVAVKGDVTGDGKLRNSDVIQLKAAALGKLTFEALDKLVGDVTGDGKLRNSDVIQLKAAALGKLSLPW